MESNSKYIIGKNLDIWFTGLASIIVIIPLLLLDQIKYSDLKSFATVLTFTTLINGAHFMASYRMLYFNKETALRYPTSSVVMPAALVSYCLIAINLGAKYPALISTIFIISSIYLSLHYTGQTWGMMSSLSFLEGKKLNYNNKKNFKIILKLLMLWQILWSVRILDPKPEWLVSLLAQISFVPYILITFSVVLFLKVIVDLYTEFKTLRLRFLVPILSLFTWYALLSINYLALPLVQFFHATQYLIFPLRVELNRNKLHTQISASEISVSQKEDSINSSFSINQFLQYCLALILLSGLIFVLLPFYFKSYESDFLVSFQVFIAALNIHHFYIDSCIWKLSNPIVKNELFAHIKN